MTETCSLNIRKIERAVRDKLRIRAAEHGCSLEEEVRNVLRLSVGETQRPKTGAEFLAEIRKIVEPYGGFDLELPPRSKHPIEEPDWLKDWK